MKLVAGLGNPGPSYRETRHNIGFAVLDEMAKRMNVEFESGPAQALIARVRQPAGDTGPVMLAKPLTFMNNSGEATAALMRYYRIEPSALLVVVDDVELPLGKLRARAGGSAGGHNGLKSIIAHLGHDFARLRVGVGRGNEDRPRRELADHVLSRFDASERVEVERMTARAADAAEMFITFGVAEVMNTFNGSDPAVTE